MAYVDFNFVWSGKFAKLSSPAQSVLFVVAAVASFKTGEFYHSVPIIAEKSGLKIRSTQLALKELEKEEVLKSEPCPGKPTKRIYLPAAIHPLGESDPCTPMHPPVHPHAPDRCTPMHPNNSIKQQLKTTTAADRISKDLILEMKALYGSENVERVVDAMVRMDGYIKDANAYFRACVTRGWIPTSKRIRDMYELREKERRFEEEQERKRQDFEKLSAQVERESHDPEVQQRIKKLCDEFNNKYQ